MQPRKLSHLNGEASTCLPNKKHLLKHNSWQQRFMLKDSTQNSESLGSRPWHKLNTVEKYLLEKDEFMLIHQNLYFRLFITFSCALSHIKRESAVGWDVAVGGNNCSFSANLRWITRRFWPSYAGQKWRDNKQYVRDWLTEATEGFRLLSYLQEQDPYESRDVTVVIRICRIPTVSDDTAEKREPLNRS